MLSDASENEQEESSFSFALCTVQLSWLAEITQTYLRTSFILLVLFQGKGELWRKWNHLLNHDIWQKIQPFSWFTTWVKSLFIWDAGLLCELLQQAKPSWSSSTMNLCPYCGFPPASSPLNCIYISTVKHDFIQVSEVKHSLTPCT